jgi:hypothetical protein
MQHCVTRGSGRAAAGESGRAGGAGSPRDLLTFDDRLTNVPAMSTAARDRINRIVIICA